MGKKREENIRNRKKCIITFGIALIIGLIIELICSLGIKKFTGFSFSRFLVISWIIWFIAIHFVVGFKKLYTIIIDNRFVISLVMIVATTLVQMPQNSDGVLDSIVNNNSLFGLIWNIRFYAFVLISYEFFMIITKESKYVSFIGAIILAFSGHVQFLFNYIDAIIVGEFGFVFYKKYLDSLKDGNRIVNSSKKIDLKKMNIYFTITLAAGILYSLTYYSFAVSYGYVFLGLVVWQIILNWKELKENGKIKDALIPVLVVLVENVLVGKFIRFHSEQMVLYSRGVLGIFDYLYTVLIPFANVEHGSILASFVSLYPVPLFIALFCLYRDEKHIEFLLPMAVICVLESITYFSNGEGVFQTINRFTLFSNVNANVLLCAINYSSLIMVFYMISNFEERIFSFKVTMRISLIATIVAFLMMNRPEELRANRYLYIMISEFVLLLFTFLNYDDKRYKGLFLASLLAISLITGSMTNPIIRDKNLAFLDEDVPVVIDREYIGSEDDVEETGEIEATENAEAIEENAETIQT